MCVCACSGMASGSCTHPVKSTIQVWIPLGALWKDCGARLLRARRAVQRRPPAASSERSAVKSHDPRGPAIIINNKGFPHVCVTSHPEEKKKA